jgi:hypothetical protein
MTEMTAANVGSPTANATQCPRVMKSPTTSGHGKTGERLEREAAARRAVFAAALAGFVTLFGLIAIGGKPTPAVSQKQPALVSDVTRANRVIAEIPITGLTDDTTQTIIRLVAPEPRVPALHVRTRAS